jgi:hypothetical protein
MGWSVTRESGCTDLLATFDSSGALQTKRPKELSDGPNVSSGQMKGAPGITLRHWSRVATQAKPPENESPFVACGCFPTYLRR